MCKPLMELNINPNGEPECQIPSKRWPRVRTINGAFWPPRVRYALTEPELVLRDWFRNQADERGMPVTDDGNGNLFAWWGAQWARGAVLTGSHFDSVPHGGG